MSSFVIFAVILAILVVCVAAISIIQKREHEKAALRQKIAQHRYRANQASNILSNFSQQPIGPEARQILLQYCLANMKAIEKLAPGDLNAKKSIEALKQNINNPKAAADNQKLSIPSDLNLLTQQVNQLSTLAKFILKLSKTNMVTPSLSAVAVNKIMALISESKICAYIQQGKESLSKHEYVPAQRNFIMAQQMLVKVQNKNERLKTLEVELHELIKSSPTEAMNTELSFGQPGDQQQQPQHETEENGSHDDLFGPRKKW
ncbi:hypothetical protein [Aliikangiella coralliicola]|uniref:Uncharacterized protein n=1 Tax=Aliikangiella coralliicola TaxID=2592383 RepID=A0A545U0B1_9GAMM|nr:hypothetical protein [Aliikangiella coralliicola]TQV82901.1 hypothetical protein FLL46_24330 [Aliikangiella coralliicola]